MRPATLVVGARPNFMKAAPVVDALRAPESGWRVRLVHTGQHYDDRLSDVFFRQLGMPAPDSNLAVGSGTAPEQTGRAMIALEADFVANPPEAVIVFGDVNSTVAAAMAASRLQIPVVHVEAGLRSFDRTMPEEVNRVLTDALASLLFVTEQGAIANLAREGIDVARAHFVGNTMIDTLERHREAAAALDMPSTIGAAAPYVLVTLHRPSNVDDPRALTRIVEVLMALAVRLDVVFPAHPRTVNRLEETGLAVRLRASRVVVVEALGYLEFMNLMMHAAVVLTDSGGVQDETTALGVPCVTLRPNTERPITIEQGTNILAGDDVHKAIAIVTEILDGGRVFRARRPDLWDGHAAQRIARVLRDWPTGPVPCPPSPKPPDRRACRGIAETPGA